MLEIWVFHKFTVYETYNAAKRRKGKMRVLSEEKFSYYLLEDESDGAWYLTFMSGGCLKLISALSCWTKK